jgi:hypothetical protein
MRSQYIEMFVEDKFEVRNPYKGYRAVVWGTEWRTDRM